MGKTARTQQQKFRPANMRRGVRYAVYCGLGAGMTSQAMLALAAWAERKPLARPINATSHWFWGDEAGRSNMVDLRHTGLGLATNQASAMFWGTLFGIYLIRRAGMSGARIMRNAAATGLFATTLGYALLPKRLTPGWELALGRRSVALTLAATAVGLGLGGILAGAKEK